MPIDVPFHADLNLFRVQSFFTIEEHVSRRVRRLDDTSGHRRKSLRLTPQRQNQWIIPCPYDQSDSERIESHSFVRWRQLRGVLNGSGSFSVEGFVGLRYCSVRR